MQPEPTEKQPLYSVVPIARAVTPRPSLDLLDLYYPFSQVRLLTASEFAKQAELRRSRSAHGLPMGSHILEVLHRHGVLVPLYRVDRTPGVHEHNHDGIVSLTATKVRATAVPEFLRGTSDERVADPAAEEFHHWHTERGRTPGLTYDSEYLYSRHQTLGLDMATSFIQHLTAERLSDSNKVWRLDDGDNLSEPMLEAYRSWRSFSIVLSALDTYYWPAITHTVSHDLSEWRKARQAFVPAEMLSWLEITEEQVAVQADELRSEAASRDVMGDFYDLIRRADPRAWDSLRGDALNAMDFRLAADILDRFQKELGGTGAPSGVHVPLNREGLSSKTHSLDAALTNLHLSPFPALVIGVEGETERRILPRVMEMLDINPARMCLVEYGGTTKGKHLSLLARYAVQPMLGRDLGGGTALDRPVTRFLLLADAENDYETTALNRKQNTVILDFNAQEIPPKLRRDLYNNTLSGRMVEIRTWGKYPFEFAHFRDDQLADALQSAASSPYPGGRAALVAAIHNERLTTSPNIDKINWRGRGKLSKPDLADTMWPILEQRIHRAIKGGHKGPPIMQAAVRAHGMAAASWRGIAMLRRR